MQKGRREQNENKRWIASHFVLPHLMSQSNEFFHFSQSQLASVPQIEDIEVVQTEMERHREQERSF